MRRCGALVGLLVLAATVVGAASFDFVAETSATNPVVGFRVYGAVGVGVSWDGGANWTPPVSGADVLLTNNYGSADMRYISVTGKATRVAFYGTGCTPALLRDITSPLTDGLTGINSALNMFRECTGITSFSCPTWFDAASTNVTTLWGMFQQASNFNCPGVTNWSTTKVTSLRATFHGAAAFNQDISTKTVNAETPQAYTAWNVAKVTDFGQNNSNQHGTFSGAAAFNQPIGNWDTSSAIYMELFLNGATAFDQDIGTWNTANVTTMRSMFNNAVAFNQNLGAWNTAKVTTMQLMFAGAKRFNNGGSDSINTWDVAKVTTLWGTFMGATDFNQPLGRWNTSKVTSMRGVFESAASFNQDISTRIINADQPDEYVAWDVSNVTDFGVWKDSCHGMFNNAKAFNQPIGNWNVSQAATLNSMFAGATAFDQDLSAWRVTNATDCANLFNASALSGTNYSKLLLSWSEQPLRSAVPFHGGSGKYTLEAAGGKVTIIRNNGWIFTDGGIEAKAEYAVSKPMELQGCALHLDKTYTVTQDIDLAETTSWNGGAGFWPIGTVTQPFTGTFKGEGCVLSNLHLARPTLDCAGLFGKITGTVRRLGVTGAVTGSDNVGGLFGKLSTNGVVEDCYARVAVTAAADDRHRGSFGGRNERGIMRRVYATGTVMPLAGSHGGGLVGSADVGGAYEDTANFWDTEASGWATSAMGSGRATSRMREIGTYTGWDMAPSHERRNDRYPYLALPAVGEPTWRISISDGTIILIN